MSLSVCKSEIISFRQSEKLKWLGELFDLWVNLLLHQSIAASQQRCVPSMADWIVRRQILKKKFQHGRLLIKTVFMLLREVFQMLWHTTETNVLEFLQWVLFHWDVFVMLQLVRWPSDRPTHDPKPLSWLLSMSTSTSKCSRIKTRQQGHGNWTC